jgi:hypothetical protein
MTYAVVVTGVGVSVQQELALTSQGVPSKMRIVLLSEGANMAWDGCDCGQFIQAIQRINPTRVFPSDSSLEPVVACEDPSMMATVAASVQRCAAVTPVNGITPTPAALLTSGLQQQEDSYALWRGIRTALCAMKRSRLITAYKVGAQEYPGPEGKCRAVLVTYSFQVV